MEKEHYSSWLEVDLGAFQNNIKECQQITGRPVMAVVKANGYGHGMVEVSRAAEQIGVDWLGVARLEEGLVLRESGIHANILVLGYTQPAAVTAAASADIRLAVFDPDIALAYSQRMADANLRLSVHAKFDSGMGRLGTFTENGLAFMQYLKELPGLDVEGAFTHFARADQPTLPTTENQIQRFSTLIKELETTGLRPRIVHAANSGATLYYPDAWFDMVRPGICLYGLVPSREAPLPKTFRPGFAWKTTLVSIKTMPPGHGIGYGHRYVTSRTEKIGVLPIGYADGWRRVLNKNVVLIHGKRVPVVGTVCMDQCMIPLDSIPEARIGDEVVLVGKQGNEVITADDVADAWDTIGYEVATGLAARLPRFLIQ